MIDSGATRAGFGRSDPVTAWTYAPGPSVDSYLGNMIEDPLHLDFAPPPHREPLRIVYQDEHLCVVYKPAGLQVHRGQGADRKDPFLLQILRDQLGTWVTPIHRLDRPTSGLVVFALHHEAASRLSAQWREGRVSKKYCAIVRGWFPGKAAAQTLGLGDSSENTLGRDPFDFGGDRAHSTACGASQRMGVPDFWTLDEDLPDPETQVMRSAQTQMRPLAQVEVPLPIGPYPQARYTWMELRPLTGRWHQLRRHLSHLAHPILGDTVHGCRHQNHGLREALAWWRLMLDAVELRLEHPMTGEHLEFVAQGEWGLEPYWRQLCALQKV